MTRRTYLVSGLALGLALAGCRPKPPAITPETVKQSIRADNYVPEAAAKLENDAANAVGSDRLTARVLLAEAWMRAQSPVLPAEVRERLKVLIADAPDSWQAQIARLQIMRTYNVHTETDAMIAAADEALVSGKFHLLNNPQDPLLLSYLETMNYRVQDLREVIVYMRGACYATAMDLDRARLDYTALSDSPLKTQLGYQIRDVEALSPEQRIKRREILIETVKRSEANTTYPN